MGEIDGAQLTSPLEDAVGNDLTEGKDRLYGDEFWLRAAHLGNMAPV